MNRSISFLLVAQFATAFADRAIFFILFVMIGQIEGLPEWYTPVLQIAFILAYVLFAPWAGAFSDSRPKRNVLITGNLIKLGGLGILFVFSLHQGLSELILLGYFVVGFGAVLFSPAKYGLVPELVAEQRLVRVNGWLEGATIVAILLGQYAGASLGEFDPSLALGISAGIYVLSTLLVFGIRRTPVIHKPRTVFYKDFISDFKQLLQHHVVRFALLGVSLFWSVAAILQVLVLEWAKDTIRLEHASEISLLGIYIGIGIIIGSVLIPNFVGLGNLRRTRFAAYAMGGLIILLSQLSQLYLIYAVLILIGVAGGALVVPINAALEEVGHKSVGSGGAVAVQRFCENLSMVMALVVYTVVLASGARPVMIMLVMGIVILVLTALISLNLPARDTDLMEQ